MSQWTIQIESTADGRYQWRHVPADGAGDAVSHGGGNLYDTPEAARVAGEEALARHHESAADGSTPSPSEGVSPLSISSLPVEAQVRTADEAGSGLR